MNKLRYWIVSIFIIMNIGCYAQDPLFLDLPMPAIVFTESDSTNFEKVFDAKHSRLEVRYLWVNLREDDLHLYLEYENGKHQHVLLTIDNRKLNNIPESDRNNGELSRDQRTLEILNTHKTAIVRYHSYYNLWSVEMNNNDSLQTKFHEY